MGTRIQPNYPDLIEYKCKKCGTTYIYKTEDDHRKCKKDGGLLVLNKIIRYK